MDSSITVALLQMAAHGNDEAANRAKGDAFCRRARAMGADIALFPEMWTIGYTPYLPFEQLSDVRRAPELWTPEARTAVASPELIARWQAQAITQDSPYVAHFRALARDLGMAIAITYLERWPGAPRNTMALIDRHGEIVLTYAKVHTCAFSMEGACTPGESFPVCTLETAHGPVAVGGMICYDREFPESARLLMLNGAEVILIPNACEMEGNRIAQLRSRAFENMVGVALTNYAAPDQNGHSLAFDGRAFDEDGRSRDMVIAEAGADEEVCLAVFDLERLRAYRQRETWGNAFRRPDCYQLLIDTAVVPPFMRVDAAGRA